jgi:hypothetical protein
MFALSDGNNAPAAYGAFDRRDGRALPAIALSACRGEEALAATGELLSRDAPEADPGRAEGGETRERTADLVAARAEAFRLRELEVTEDGPGAAAPHALELELPVEAEAWSDEWDRRLDRSIRGCARPPPLGVLADASDAPASQPLAALVSRLGGP